MDYESDDEDDEDYDPDEEDFDSEAKDSDLEDDCSTTDDESCSDDSQESEESQESEDSEEMRDILIQDKRQMKPQVNILQNKKKRKMNRTQRINYKMPNMWSQGGPPEKGNQDNLCNRR